MRRALLPIAALVALIAAVAIGLSQAGGEAGGADDARGFDLAAAKRDLAGAPAPLAALHAQSNALLPGGTKAFAARVEALRGHPVVINKWASWCGPCQAEFPVFQRLAAARGKEIAFVGLNSDDARGQASTFLRDHPIPFPSYEDPDGRIADEFARAAFPTTVFLDERGRTAYIHQGAYASDADLAEDIDRYLRR